MLRIATEKDAGTLAELALLLWPEHTLRGLQDECKTILAQGGAFFLACEGGLAVGFAQCQLRRDYVEGTDSSPVGYLEGVYVREGFRGHGLARALLAACESWAREQGCTEFASDCELHNEPSLRFHLRAGFEEAGRIICFRKAL